MWRSERRRGATAAAFGIALALGAGCAAIGPASGDTSTPASAPAAPAPAEVVREWSGRFSASLVSSVPGANQDTAAGRFVLVSNPSAGGRTLDLELASPFGQTIARGRRGVDGTSAMTLADGRTLRAPTLDALIEQAVGWPLPIERLPDWLDDRFETVLARDASGGIALAQDSGWRIEREPRRWALQRPHAGGSLRVVMVLDR